MEPVLAKAARKLGIDQVAIRRINAPGRQGAVRPCRTRRQARATSPARSSRKRWIAAPSSSAGRSEERAAASAAAPRCAASASRQLLRRRLDRLRRACSSSSPTARCTSSPGIGNSGTESVQRRPPRGRRDARHAVGESRSHLGQHRQEPAVDLRSGGSQTTHAMTRAAHAAATDAGRSCRRSRPRTSAAARRITRSPTSASSEGRRRRHDAGAGRANAPSNSAASTTATRLPDRHQHVHRRRRARRSPARD